MKAKTRKQRFRELQAAVNQGLNASIIELAQTYLHDFPKNGLAWLDYGNALADFGRYEEARVAISKAIKLIPAKYLDVPYSDMGRLYERKGNYRRAIEWYKKASGVPPKNANYLNFLGAMFAKLGKHAEAERYFKQAIKCKEGAIDESYYNLGHIVGAHGRYKEALSYFEKALKLDPKYKYAKQAIKDMRRVLEIKGTSNNSLNRTRS
jgi:tetratricopeptide (TPR) repeat protein